MIANQISYLQKYSSPVKPEQQRKQHHLLETCRRMFNFVLGVIFDSSLGDSELNLSLPE